MTASECIRVCCALHMPNKYSNSVKLLKMTAHDSDTLEIQSNCYVNTGDIQTLSAEGDKNSCCIPPSLFHFVMTALQN